MNFSTILGMLPLIMKAYSLAKSIGGNTTIADLIKSKGPEVVDLIKEAGAEIFPDLNEQEQTQAGALRFSPEVVSKVQSQLNKLGAQLAIDGDYGRRTKEAVTAFQTKYKLDADGWAGPITQAK